MKKKQKDGEKGAGNDGERLSAPDPHVHRTRLLFRVFIISKGKENGGIEMRVMLLREDQQRHQIIKPSRHNLL